MYKGDADDFEDSEFCFELNKRNKPQKLSYFLINILKTTLYLLSKNITENKFKVKFIEITADKIENFS